ncbi:MAG: hypothetical protein PHE15_05940 [Dehalococcoidales bacterium]|nr:hypothetical protein [Dehalococcoidales bacterium]
MFTATFKKYMITVFIVSFALIFLGCQAPNPVSNIHIVKASRPGEPLPTGMWLMLDNGPHLTTIHNCYQGDELLINLEIKSEVETAVTFTKFSLYDKGAGTEETLGLSEDLIPVEPGGSNTWRAQLPYKDGEFELRIYLGNNVVASALINIS